MYEPFKDQVLDELAEEDAGLEGDDTRDRVTDTTRWPYSTVCKLRIRFPNKTKRRGGSGVLIGNKYVLTAGHNAYARKFGGYATDIEVIPALNGTNKPFGSASVANWRLFTGWTQDQKRGYDIAVLSLSTTIGDTIGWLGLYEELDVERPWTYTSGYPRDKGGTHQYCTEGDEMYVPTSNQEVICHKLDTYGGQSGSGLWRIVDGAEYVFAVHVNDSGAWNEATLITSWKFEAIRDFIESGR
jgi:glutamyl endopeptidase